MPRRLQEGRLGRSFATKQPSTFAADKKVAKLRVEFSEIAAFGDRLKEFRLRKQLRPFDMARLLRMDAGRYRNWESGKRVPSYAEWKRARGILSEYKL